PTHISTPPLHDALPIFALATLIAVDACRIPTQADLSIVCRRSTAKTRRYASPELLWHIRPMSPCGRCPSELRAPTNARSCKPLRSEEHTSELQSRFDLV